MPFEMTTRRTALIGLAALAVPMQAHALSASETALVDKAVDYLQSLTSVKGRFVQTDPRGARTKGSIYLKRPGKARFDYDAPSGLLVVSDGSRVSVHDTRLKTFNQYPLSSTPLALFLAREVRLDKGVEVTSVERLGGGFRITARDGKKKTRGKIVMTFSDAPVALKEWTVVDAQGGATRVQIAGLKPASLNASLFRLKDPRPRSGPRPM